MYETQEDLDVDLSAFTDGFANSGFNEDGLDCRPPASESLATCSEEGFPVQD